MSTEWARLETHVVNGAFPLHRCVGSSDHSGVFLTQSAAHSASTVALKLIHFESTSADAHLARWRAAADLSHPHLIRIFEAGECHVDGLHCLYVLMENAEQNLAQLLEQRALLEHEARELLVPALSALAHLHESQLIQGQLKPSNILVVEDQVKLASDTVRAVGATTTGTNAVSVYDAPEAREGRWSTASDIWALGITLCEAFARRPPQGVHGAAGEGELPSELPVPFRGAVSRCLSRNPDDRPRVSELQSWLRGETAMPQPPKPRQAQGSSAVRLVIRAQILPKEEPDTPIRQRSSRRLLPLVLGAVALLAVGWVGYRVFRADAPTNSAARPIVRDVGSPDAGRVSPPTPAPSEAASLRREAPAPQAASAGVEPAPPRPASVSAESRPPKPASVRAETPPSKPAPARVEAPAPKLATSTATSALNEVIPNVPRSALQTIRGTVRVSVRVIVDKDGTVVAATPDEPGPSRYFERLSLEASKKWTFPPASTEEQRLMQLQFNYRRTGPTASARPLQ